ncbi:MAG: hypothetical protein IPP64_03785 [Bacteroidetes bacterium]|nr:hypothetical protein [Bacteroidota bacterium]
MKTAITLLSVIITNSLFACDFCGCFMGITPYDNHSSITAMYRYKMFNGYQNTDQHHNVFQKSALSSNTSSNTFANSNGNYNALKHGSTGSPNTEPVQPKHLQSDYELYTTAELRAKFFIHKRIELNAVIPFTMNTSSKSDLKQKISGISDLTFFTGIHLINRTMTEKFQHRLILGAGIKLPVGDYYQKDENNQRIDFLLQPGTGSIDYMSYLNYVFGYKKLGINFMTAYKINGDNYYHERIGNSTTNYLNLFYKFRQDKDLKLFPSIQGYYEYTKGLYIDKVYQPATEMNIATAGIGLDVFYKQISINTSFQLPISEKKFDGNLATAGKFLVGLTYSFNQKKYLLKSKKES